MLRLRPAYRNLSEADCSERQAARHRRCSDLRPSLSPGATFHWLNARKSPFSRCRAIPYGRLGAAWDGLLRRSPVNGGRTATRGGWIIGPQLANGNADRSARRPKPTKLAPNAALRTYVEERLAGSVVAPSGLVLLAPPFGGTAARMAGERIDDGPRSPEQIARRLPIDFPDEKTMRISREAIYQALFVQGRGVLRSELTACLRRDACCACPTGAYAGEARALSRRRS